jgi:tripartite-type tricarboxylate transporter receptor subunit TctC
LVGQAPDLLLGVGGTVVGSLQRATRDVPIVFVGTTDPVNRGLVASLPYSLAAQTLAISDLLGGQEDVTFAVVSTAIEYIRAGKLRALAVTSATRQEALPDIPTMADFLPGYEASGWFGLLAPKNTPAEIVDKLNREINAALADPKVKARLADLGGTVLPGSPADFGKLVVDDKEKWAKVIRAANIKPE